MRDLLRQKPFDGIIYMRIGEKNPDAHWNLISEKRYGMLHLYKGPQRIARSATTKRDEMEHMLQLAYQDPRS